MTSPFAVFRRNQRTFMVALVCMAMFAFVFLDAVSNSSGMFGSWFQKDPVVATYQNGKELRSSELQDQIKRFQIATSFFDRASGFQPREFPNIRDIALNMKIYKDRAESLGVTISDATVEEYIKQQTGGRLSSKQFWNILNEFQISSPQLYEVMRVQIQANLASAVSMHTPTITPEEYWEAFKELEIRQSLELTALPLSEFIAQIDDPSEEELEEFFDRYKKENNQFYPERKIGFKQPDRMVVQYLTINYEDVEAQVPDITDQEIQDFYEKNKDVRYVDIDLGGKDPKKEPLDPEFAPETGKPEEAKPKEVEPDENSENLGENKPQENKPEEGKPEGTKPEENKPEENKPEEKKTEKASPEEKKPCQATTDEESASPDKETINAEKNNQPETKPAEEKPTGEENSEEKKPEGTPPEEEKTGETKPEEEQSEVKQPETNSSEKTKVGAKGEKEKKPKKYLPLDDELKLKISEEIHKERTRKKLEEVFEKVTDELGKLQLKYVQPPITAEDGKTIFIDFDTDGYPGEGEPFTELESALKDPSRIPRSVSTELVDRVREIADKELSNLAKKLGLKYVQTDLMTANEFREIQGIGEANLKVDNLFDKFPLWRSLILDKSTYRPLQAQQPLDRSGFSLDLISLTDGYIAWKSEHVKAHVPELDEPGIRDQVLHAWKHEQALPKARKRATELVEKIEAGLKAGKSMPEILGSETVVGDAEGLSLTVVNTPSFSWYTVSTAITPNGMVPQIELTKLPQVEKIGEEFMEVVFNQLKVDEVGFAGNQDLSFLYLTRVSERNPSTEEGMKLLHEKFLESREGNHMQIANGHREINQSLWQYRDVQNLNIEWVPEKEEE